MARGVNKVILLGNLGRDPEVRYTAGGAAITSIAIATTEGWKDKSSGELQERTEWHNIVFFNRLAEVAGEYLRKGSQVYVEGSLRTQKYTDRNGVERYRTEIIASELQMLGSSGSQQQRSGAPAQQSGYNNNAPQGQPSSGSAPARQEESMPDFDAFDDDIPF